MDSFQNLLKSNPLLHSWFTINLVTMNKSNSIGFFTGSYLILWISWASHESQKVGESTPRMRNRRSKTPQSESSDEKPQDGDASEAFCQVPLWFTDAGFNASAYLIKICILVSVLRKHLDTNLPKGRKLPVHQGLGNHNTSSYLTIMLGRKRLRTCFKW